MQPDYFDNRARIVKDELVAQIGSGDRVSMAASVFSMYAYRELSEQLEGLDEFRFIFTSDAFTASRPKREKREFYIPRLSRAQGLFGTQFEIKLRNELSQKAVDAESRIVAISHGDCPEDAQALAEKVTAIAKPNQLIICQHEPFSGAHVGPGMLALFFPGTLR